MQDIVHNQYTSRSLLLPRIAPQRLLFMAMVLSFSGALICIWWSSANQPWLGVAISDTEEGAFGVTITATARSGPLHGIVTPGTNVIAVHSRQGQVVKLGSFTTIDEPDVLPTFTLYNQFFEHQAALFAMLQEDLLYLELEDGSLIPVRPQAGRPVSNLPLPFWITVIIGTIGFMIGIGVWSFQRGQPATSILALGGTLYYVGSISSALYLGRELAIDPSLFRLAAYINHFCYIGYAISAVVLLWHYPQRLGRQPLPGLLFIAIMLFMINEFYQWYEWPIHTFYLIYPLPVIAGLVLAWLQWQRAKGKPVALAVLSWFLLSIFVTLTMIVLLYFVPIIIIGEEWLASWMAQFFALMFYLGLAAGVARFQLFNLQRWWFSSWLWLLGGISVVAFDVLLVLFLRIDPISALSIAILLAGWVYFPIRQKLLTIFNRSPEEHLVKILPQLIYSVVASTDNRDFENHWQHILKEIFDPIDLSLSNAIAQSTLAQDGLVLMIPSISARHGYQLTGRGKANQLFNHDDIKLANTLRAIIQNTQEILLKKETAAHDERKRIMRDLHDDVGAKLLTLIHRLGPMPESTLANEALSALRDTIYTIDETSDSQLIEYTLIEWQSELMQRCYAADVELVWHESIDNAKLILNKRRKINITRVLREATSNALKHADPQYISCDYFINQSRFQLVICNDGKISDPLMWPMNAGRSNMFTRIEEVGGNIEWKMPNLNQERVCVYIDLPIGKKQHE